MATFRGENNAKGVAQPLELVKKNERSGEVMFAVDRIEVPSGAANGDVILMQELPANAKPLRVKVVPSADLGAGSITVGYSSSEELGDKDATVAADADAFIPASDPDGLAELDMGVAAAGYLAELDKPVFLSVTLATLPANAVGETITVLLEYVAK